MTLAMAMLQRDSQNMFGALFGGMWLLFWLVGFVVVIIGGWKVFEKSGQPGWAIIVPIYNAYIFLKIAGRPGWWLILYFIPLINIVIALIVSIDIAKAFGQSAVFGVVLLFLFCVIGLLVLGFGNYRYQSTPMTAPLRA